MKGKYHWVSFSKSCLREERDGQCLDQTEQYGNISNTRSATEAKITQWSLIWFSEDFWTTVIQTLENEKRASQIERARVRCKVQNTQPD